MPQHFVQAAASLQQAPSQPAVAAGFVHEPLPQEEQLAQPEASITLVARTAVNKRMDFIMLDFRKTTPEN